MHGKPDHLETVRLWVFSFFGRRFDPELNILGTTTTVIFTSISHIFRPYLCMRADASSCLIYNNTVVSSPSVNLFTNAGWNPDRSESADALPSVL